MHQQRYLLHISDLTVLHRSIHTYLSMELGKMIRLNGACPVNRYVHTRIVAGIAPSITGRHRLTALHPCTSGKKASRTGTKDKERYSPVGHPGLLAPGWTRSDIRRWVIRVYWFLDEQGAIFAGGSSGFIGSWMNKERYSPVGHPGLLAPGWTRSDIRRWVIRVY